ncbi:MAG: P-II family nitrogen regulator [Methanosarcinales archaeon]|nr:P-II family nitrogen regulator [Methanosarcinales archaeon]
MKMVVAIIRTEKLHEVMDSLEAAGIKSLTASSVKGRGTQKGITQQWRGREYTVDLLEKTKLEIVVTDDLVDATINAIKGSATTGNIGDGKIFVQNVETAIRIRTGTTGDTAI